MNKDEFIRLFTMFIHHSTAVHLNNNVLFNNEVIAELAYEIIDTIKIVFQRMQRNENRKTNKSENL